MSDKKKKSASLSPQGQTQDRFTEIASAAEAFFQKLGYAKTSMANIANHLGIGRTTLYDYFTSKEDILFYLIEARITSPQPVELEGSFEQKLKTLVVSSLSRLAGNFHLYKILFTEHPALGSPAGSKIRDWQEQLLDQTRTVINDAITQNEFIPRCSVDQIIFVYQALLGQKMNQLLRDDTITQNHNFSEDAEILVDLMIRGTGATQTLGQTAGSPGPLDVGRSSSGPTGADT